MSLSNDVISKFVKMSKNDTSNVKKESTVYGTVSKIEAGQVYVKLDGATGAYTELPVSETVEVIEGDRVVVTIKNHAAIITSNLSKPSGSLDTTNQVKKELNKNINNNSASILNINTLLGYQVDTENLNADYARIKNIETNYATTKHLEANYATIGKLENEYATTKHLEANYATIGKLENEYTTTENLEAKYATIERLEVVEGQVKDLGAVNLEAVNGSIENLNTRVGNIENITSKVVTTDNITSEFSNSVISQVGDAQIKSAQIQSIAASKIKAGKIITNDVTVESEDGSLKIYDETIQIKDSSRVRVQIGKDAENDYSISVWDANGNLMFNKGGLTESAIKKAIIRNDMVSETANIHASKLDIDSLFEEIDGSTNTIKSTKITVDDEGQTLEAKLTTLATTESVDGLSKTVTSQGTQITAIQGNITNKIWQQDINKAVNSIDVGGRNLYIIKNAEEGFLTVGGTTWGAMDQVHQEHTSEYILVEEGEQYVFQLWVTVNETYGNDPNLWMGYDFFDADKNTISNRPAKRSLNKLPNGQAYDIYYITIPEGAAYLRVSARFYADGLVKLEKGNVATEWSPAPEDVDDNIKSLSTKYSSLEQTVDGISATVSEFNTTYATKDELTDTNDALYTTNSEVAAVKTRMSTAETTITQHSDSIRLCATKTEVENIKIGGRNLYIEKDAVDGYLASNGDGSITAASIVTKEKTSGLIPVKPGDKIQFQLWVTTPETSYIWYAYQFFKEDETILDDNRPSQHLSDTVNGYYHVTYPSITVPEGAAYIRVSARMFEDGKIKVEIGTKATDWTPAPEDMATDDDLTRSQAATEEVSSRVTTAESLIEQLSHSISMLVTDGNGTSLMTQTDTGWVFSTENIQNTVNRISEDLSALSDDVGDVDNTVSILQQAVDDLGVLGEYIQITTYEDEPCIELGELDSDFKLRITNTRMMFTEGSVVLAYFTNQSFHSKKVVVEEELQQGGFVWKARANGNLGLVWKGGNG